ncbi:hypothetical protein SAMN05421543_1892 [Alicyclobacillus macrosporangiidus]|uniref:Uncharacterized protein n=1 Tax=Alicyclobacillus macrosporangiidus TaxID=392015 RepID=A0A1I7LLF7_9BACL|nr:hypothetical protein SAMN05421543_1892 [Alicyclobacillus macrosporangiidus]
MSCFICEKHLGMVGPPPGGYIYEDNEWMVCHFPAGQSVLGQLVVESRRHVLDFSEMTDHEVMTYGILVKKLYSALKLMFDSNRPLAGGHYRATARFFRGSVTFRFQYCR